MQLKLTCRVRTSNNWRNVQNKPAKFHLKRNLRQIGDCSDEVLHRNFTEIVKLFTHLSWYQFLQIEKCETKLSRTSLKKYQEMVQMVQFLRGISIFTHRS